MGLALEPLAEIAPTEREVAGATVANVLSTKEVLHYMKNDFVTGEPGAVKGTQHPDGRKTEKPSIATPSEKPR